ncbi:MAG TPA: VWA domain-containing protein [Planctomycetes bacterium]|nr:VWA domain-containing protein [Planctomycetota bacterium]
MRPIRSNLTHSLVAASLFSAALAAGCTSSEHAPRAVKCEESGDAAAGGESYALHEARRRTHAPNVATPAAKLDGYAAPADCEQPAPEPMAGPGEFTGGEGYVDYGVRPFVNAATDPRSTFSIDVDTGSYTIARRKLREGQLPPPAAVRAEEFVNYFRQDYPDAAPGRSFAVVSEAAASPFRPGKTILRVGLQGRRLHAATRRRANLVFLVDTSGSMQSPDKLGLVKRSLALLVDHLRPDDRVSICTYAGSVRKVLDPTPASERGTILRALARLHAGGSTAMGSGIQLAYQLASAQAGPEVNTRVLVCSDGDANVGPRSHHQILDLIAGYQQRGITLGTIGFGMGNYKDTMMEQLANKGNGSYAYVDGMEEARRLFAEELIENLEVIARDVKLQVVFDPARVRRYRLIGYENRAIADRDFRNDAVDAGEVGAGHRVTALYELELVPGGEGVLGAVHLRYKPGVRRSAADERAREESYALTREAGSFAAASQRFRFTACVGELAEVLRKSHHVQTSLPELVALIERSLDRRHDDREHDLLDLAQRAAFLAGRAGS